jgi:hypothetical protein
MIGTLRLAKLRYEAELERLNQERVILRAGGGPWTYEATAIGTDEVYTGKIYPPGGDVEGFRDTAPRVIQEAAKGTHGPVVPHGGAEERLARSRGEIEAPAEGIVEVGRVINTATGYKCSVAIAR